MLTILLATIAISLAVSYPLTALYRKDRSSADLVLFVALCTTAAAEGADLCAQLFPKELYFWKQIALGAESCLAPAWLCYSLVFSRERRLTSIPVLQKVIFPLSLLLIAVAVSLPVYNFFYSPDFSRELLLFLKTAGFYFYLGVVATLVIALVNLEATLGGASITSRWKIRLEVLGAGGLLTVLIFYYSQGVLYRTLDMHLTVVRSLAIIVAVTLIAWSRIRGGSGVKVVLSRQMAYRSFVLLAIGAYLMFIGLIGEGLKYFGEMFQRSMLVMVAFLAAITLLVFILSDKARRKLNLFLANNFYQNKHDYRTQWLEFTDRLSRTHSNRDVFSAILSVYCDTFGMRSAALYLSDKSHGIFFPADTVDLDDEGRTFSADDPAVANLLNDRGVLCLCEMAGCGGLDPDGYFRSRGICFLVPLFSSGTILDGFIMLGNQVSTDERYTYEDYDLMLTLAQQASSALLNMRLIDELAVAKEMEALGRVATFVIHDLKNLVYTISLTVDNARTYIVDPEFQVDMLETLGNTVTKMNALISRLNVIPDKKAAARERTDLVRLVNETVALVKRCEITSFMPPSPVEAYIDFQDIQKVVLNLVLNAVEATEGLGPVLVEVGVRETPFISVTDKGCGISEEFIRTRLFTPFQTTKKSGLGIGLFQCRQVVESHHGRIDVISTLGQGATFTVWLPNLQAGGTE